MRDREREKEGKKFLTMILVVMMRESDHDESNSHDEECVCMCKREINKKKHCHVMMDKYFYHLPRFDQSLGVQCKQAESIRMRRLFEILS